MKADKTTRNGFCDRVWLFAFMCLLMISKVQAQDATLVQIKTFDQSMKPMSGIGVSLNGKEFILIEKKGTVFQNVLKEDLPPKSVRINREELEAESWNYGKGTLEIIIRKKTYKIVSVRVKNEDNKSLVNLTLQYNGAKTTTATTNNQGVIQLPLGLTEDLSADKFLIPAFRVTKVVDGENEKTIIIESLTPPKPKETVAAPVVTQRAVKEFNMNQLDTITSLAVFYKVFRNYDISEFDEVTRKKIDEKFAELAAKQNQAQEKQFIENISDTSHVSSDVENLLAQARLENQLLDDFRADFNQKIQIINDKLAGGTTNMDAVDRDKLLNDINAMEEVLRQNESKFSKNISDYRLILASLKSSFFDIKNLENKLEEVEAEREKDRESFRRQILIFGSILFVFATLLVILFYLRIRLKKQQKSLIVANDQITVMNENLENLVFERTRLLADAYREMDIFLYRASHDLRSPISSIIGLCNLAQYSNGNETRDLVNQISKTASKMDTMLDKLKIISEINQPTNYSHVKFSELLEHITQRFSKFIADNNVSIVLDFPKDIAFSSYPNLLEIILSNLVENALFFCTVNQNIEPRIIVTAGIENNLLKVRVHDNGVGIDHEIHSKLWGMFFVGHERSKGHGLGLFIVAKALHTLNGTIDVESEVGKFTLFTLTIPVNTDEINVLMNELTAARASLMPETQK